MPGGPGKMTWDGDANTQLLLCILAVHEISVNFTAVAHRLGPNCTPRAVQEQLKKLKKKALEEAGEGGEEGDDAADSPTKGGKGLKKKATLTPKKGSAKKQAANAAGEESPTPTKKRGRQGKVDGEAKSPAVKKQKKANGDAGSVLAKTKGKKAMTAESSSSAAVDGEGSHSPNSSEAPTIKLEKGNEDEDGVDAGNSEKEEEEAEYDGAADEEIDEGLGMEDAVATEEAVEA